MREKEIERETKVCKKDGGYTAIVALSAFSVRLAQRSYFAGKCKLM